MIEVKNLVKHYGDVQAVNNIDFTINDGEIVGFLGANGAGKSTVLKILTFPVFFRRIKWVRYDKYLFLLIKNINIRKNYD